eukprot:3641616-Pyramimonas_sp.AAC.1
MPRMRHHHGGTVWCSTHTTGYEEGFHHPPTGGKLRIRLRSAASACLPIRSSQTAQYETPYTKFDINILSAFGRLQTVLGTDTSWLVASREH